jgi:flagellar biosynthesis/type III secretory pathway M-ring protein FliF/YscJ
MPTTASSVASSMIATTESTGVNTDAGEASTTEDAVKSTNDGDDDVTVIIAVAVAVSVVVLAIVFVVIVLVLRRRRRRSNASDNDDTSDANAVSLPPIQPKSSLKNIQVKELLGSGNFGK